jgi:UDP-N-acetylmuramoylalanine--D-glutamate ligase
MRVLVLGTGVTGRAVARHFDAVPGADVVIADDVPAPGVLDPAAVRLDEVDLVVPSPGVAPSHPVLRAAAARSVPVRAEIDLALEVATARGLPVVAITGTNGKTTVTTWTAAMLTASGVRASTAGNIGTPLLDAVREPVDVVVAEVSSFQLHHTTEAFRPRVAVVLNIASDHLDWHGSVADYHRDKARVGRFQRPGDLLVLNAGDPGAAALAGGMPGRIARFAVSTRGIELTAPTGPVVAAEVVAGTRCLAARHDVENALASALAALDVGATGDGVLAALRALPRLHHRMELVGQAGGVRFYDDSKATNPHATRAAVERFDHVVLIAGGRNKGLDLGELRSLAPRLRAVVAIGDAAPEVEAAFAGATPVVAGVSMRDAVAAARAAAEPGDVVLLSPGCASFDWYPSYAARGDDFALEVRRLAAGRDDVRGAGGEGV